MYRLGKELERKFGIKIDNVPFQVLYTATHFSYGNTVSSLERGRGGQYSQDNAVLTVLRKVNETKRLFRWKYSSERY